MEKTKVIVSILGGPNTGRSTLAFAFQQFLTERGIVATVVDFDEHYPREDAVSRLPILAEKVSVDIVVMQTQREPNFSSDNIHSEFAKCFDPLLGMSHV